MLPWVTSGRLPRLRQPILARWLGPNQEIRKQARNTYWSALGWWRLALFSSRSRGQLPRRLVLRRGVLLRQGTNIVHQVPDSLRFHTFAFRRHITFAILDHMVELSVRPIFEGCRIGKVSDL